MEPLDVEFARKDVEKAAVVLRGNVTSGAWLKASNDVLFYSEFGPSDVRERALELHEKYKHLRIVALKKLRSQTG